MMADIALGTAQFGLSYGVANSDGQVPPSVVAEIMRVATESGIDMLDTAVVYGDAETVLGSIGLSGWRVVSKVPPVDPEQRDVRGWMERQVQASLQRMRINRLHGLLLHAPSQLAGPQADLLADSLEFISSQGYADRVGVSIQHPSSDMPRVMAVMAPGIVQAPASIADNSLANSGWASRLRETGCEIHTRSAFLQGLLLMNASDRPEWTHRWDSYWRAWDDWLAERRIEALDACLRFARSNQFSDYVVVGVNSVQHLRQIVGLAQPWLGPGPCWPEPVPEELINPSLWPQKI